MSSAADGQRRAGFAHWQRLENVRADGRAEGGSERGGLARCARAPCVGSWALVGERVGQLCGSSRGALASPTRPSSLSFRGDCLWGTVRG